jgi:DNA-binding MarR family transcriptional regulator
MKTSTELARYLQQITGQAPALGEMDPGDAAALPLFLRSAYRLVRATLFGRSFVLAMAHDGQDHATPTEFTKHVDLLRAAVQGEVALVLPRLQAHVRNRLVRQGVPFIVPGRQMFLPFLAVDLREREPRAIREHPGVLTAPAQAILLGHLLGKVVEHRPLNEIATEFGYSAMTLTKVADELAAKGLCEVVREGKTRRMTFTAAGRNLWEKALPSLGTPVRARHWIRRLVPGGWGKVVAGLTALERYTSIADDRVPTFALWRNRVRGGTDRGELDVGDGPDDAEAAVEFWTYDPARLANGNCVDRLSLYLSLRDTADERVRKELAALLEGIEW